MASWTGLEAEEMIRPEDCAELVRALLRLGPATRVPVLVGSGITPANLAQFSRAHGFIVGSSVKAGGLWCNPMDRDAVLALAGAFARLDPDR